MKYRTLPSIIQPPSDFWIKKKNMYNLSQQSDNGCWCEYTAVIFCRFRYFNKYFNLWKLCKKKDGFTFLLCKFRQILLTSCLATFLKPREIKIFMEQSLIFSPETYLKSQLSNIFQMFFIFFSVRTLISCLIQKTEVFILCQNAMSIFDINTAVFTLKNWREGRRESCFFIQDLLYA